MATKHEYRVSGVPDAPIIDNNGNIRPSSIWGNTYFVDYRNGADTNNGLSRSNARKTLGSILDNKVTSNNWDLVVVDPDSTVVESDMITLSKNRVNVVGDTTGRAYGAGAKIQVGVTTAATDIATFENTGVRNGFVGLKFINSNTVAEGLYSFVDAGEFTHMRSCEIYKDTDLDVTGAAELVCNADSPTYEDLFIGSTVNAISGAIIRPTVLMTNAIVSGKQARDVQFLNCKFARNCGNAANRFIYGAKNAGYDAIQRIMYMDHPVFINLGSSTPAQAIEFDTALSQGAVLVDNPVSYGAATAISTTTGVFVQGYTPDATGAAAGISIQAA